MRALALTFLEITEKSMALVAKGNPPILFLIFYILFLGVSHTELALSTKVHVILAIMEILLQMKPNQSLPDTNNLGKMMSGR